MTSVLIVGAGPTGLTAAIELTRLGIDVRIVDKAVSRSTTSRALGVQARTLELLRPRGVGDELLRLGNRAYRTALHARGEQIGGIEFAGLPTEYDFILMLAQSETERVFEERLNDLGVTVERGVAFTSMTQDDDAHVVLCDVDGRVETAVATYVIAADGSHSPVRKALGLPFDGSSIQQDYVLGDVHLAGSMSEDQLSIFLAERGFLAVFPMGEGRFRFMATDPDGLTGGDAEPSLADIQLLYDRTVHVPAELYDLNWSSRFRINSRHMNTLRSGRVFFGGDAAHVHSPAGGQGMNTGIQDMINLGWKLAMVIKGTARPELLDTYESDRLPVIEQLVAMTERATKVFNSTNPVAHALLTRLAPIVTSSPMARAKAAPRLAQLSANYRGRPVSKGGGRIGSLRAGDRVPDVPLARGRLYDVLDDAKFTLVVTGDGDWAEDATWEWGHVLVVRHLRASADLPMGWLLIRPDGYLAAGGTMRHAERLERWLTRWIPTPGQPSTSPSVRGLGATAI